MKIAAYTGTFNPLHTGHLAIMKHLTQKHGFDSVYLIVSPQSPFKEYMKVESGMERFLAAKTAVARHPELKVFVDDIELHLPAPQYTIRTLDALKAREPENDFTLVIGADNLCDIDKWKDFRRILTEYGVIVYPRKGYDMTAIKERLMTEEYEGLSISGCREMPGNDNSRFRIELMEDAPLVNISSTEIRAGIAAGQDMSRYLMG